MIHYRLVIGLNQKEKHGKPSTQLPTHSIIVFYHQEKFKQKENGEMFVFNPLKSEPIFNFLINKLHKKGRKSFIFKKIRRLEEFWKFCGNKLGNI